MRNSSSFSGGGQQFKLPTLLVISSSLFLPSTSHLYAPGFSEYPSPFTPSKPSVKLWNLLLKNAKWEIPAERMKMRQPHAVPLSNQAIEILHQAFELPDNSRYVFPSLRSSNRPLSDNSFNAALRRMGYTKEEVYSLVQGIRPKALTIELQKEYFENFSG